jgi:hypothetical protein
MNRPAKWRGSRPRQPTATLPGEDSEDSLENHDAAHIHQSQHGCERAVYEGAVYDVVYLVEAVAQDRHAHAYGVARKTDHGEHKASPPDQRHVYHRVDGVLEDDSTDRHRGSVGEPLDLLACYPPYAAQPQNHGGRPYDDEGVHERLNHPVDVW